MKNISDNTNRSVGFILDLYRLEEGNVFTHFLSFLLSMLRGGEGRWEGKVKYPKLC